MTFELAAGEVLAWLVHGLRQVDVRDGTRVRAGDPLIVLEDVQARAGFDALQARFHTLAATRRVCWPSSRPRPACAFRRR